MRNWQTIILSVILASIVAYGIHDWRSHREGADLDDDAETATVNRQRGGAQIRTTDRPESASPTAPAATPGSPAAPTVNEEQIRERFTAALHEMGPCLGIKAQPPGNSLEPTLDNWMETIKGDLGEPVLQTEDWSMAEITTGSGEKRRLRVEMDYSGADRIVRRVHYSRVTGETQEPIPLTTEQSEDPSETFLASLESDGTVTDRERAQRVYFGDGAEVVVTEKNGKIADITMNRSGHSFHCTPGDATQESCKCQTLGDEYQPPPGSEE